MEEVREGKGGSVGHSSRHVGEHWRKKQRWRWRWWGWDRERRSTTFLFSWVFLISLGPGIKGIICPFLSHLELPESPFWPLYTLITWFWGEEGAIFCPNPLVVPSFLNKTFTESTHHYAQYHLLPWPCSSSQCSPFFFFFFFFCICIHVTMDNEQILARRSPLPVCKTKKQIQEGQRRVVWNIWES